MNDALSRLLSSVGSVFRGIPEPLVSSPTQDPSTDITMYRVLRSFYDGVGVYEKLAYILNEQSQWHEALLPLRNPANRVVEVYSAKLWPGANLDDALPIIDTSKPVTDAIHQVWQWSNWASQKQVAARWLAIYGDLFLKVVGDASRGQVYFQLLQPETATQIDVDNRGFLTYLRLDVPITERDAKGLEVARTVTEVWDKPADRFRLWKHDKGAGAAIDQLGTPQTDDAILQVVGDDFIPVVHTKFRDTGDLRGSGSFVHALDKINDVNRSATRLHQMLFRNNRSTWVVQANALTGDKRPMPAPRFDGQTTSQAPDAASSRVTVGDDEMYYLPGLSTLQSLVPAINYDSALRILQDDLAELERDLPELAYYRLQELGGSLSGRAVRLMLSDAVDRILEARGNAEASLVRADQMALTIGNALGVLQVKGSFADGSFDHHFRDRPVIQTSDLEDAQASLAEAQAGIAWEQLGVSKEQWLRDHGYTDEMIEKMAAEKQANAEALGTQLLDQFSKGNLAVNGNGLGN